MTSNCLGLARSLREAREALKAGKTDAEAAIEREKAKQREAATSQKVRCDERSKQREAATSPTARCDERSTLLREIAEPCPCMQVLITARPPPFPIGALDAAPRDRRAQGRSQGRRRT